MTSSATKPAPALSATELAELDRRHLIHPHQSGQRTDRRVIVRGEGCTVWDAAGRELLDVTGGGNWVSQVGHGRPELAEAAASQAATLEYFTGFFEFANDKSVRLAARLAALAPGDINRVFFTCGGSEGVDTAIKVARRYHHHRGEPDRTWILARRFGYHGATYGSGTATGFPEMQQAVGPNLPHVEKLTPPWPYRTELYDGQDPTDFLVDELAATIERIGPGNIAAMIGEPVLGGGGVIPPPPDYWPRVRQLLSEHGILLIADEVVTAYGRTGAWFDSVQRGMAPDLIVTAKGLTSGYAPLGAVLLREEIGETVTGGQAWFFHGYTYSGHPVGCAVALANLDLLVAEQLLDRSLAIGDWFRSGLAPAAELPVVGQVRVVGATAGIELVRDRDTREPVPPELAGAVVEELYERHGLVLRNYGPTLVLSPPLVLDQPQAARTCSAIGDVLRRVDVAAGRLSPAAGRLAG